MPCAFITGISGQDGSFLAEFLIKKGYVVYGMVRRSSHMSNLDRLKNIRCSKQLHIHYGDITDLSSIIRIINLAYNDPFREGKPLEVYNLAAQSHVRVSFDTPMYTAQSDAIGTLNVLEAIIQLPNHDPKNVRFYQASTSELFGCTPGPQSETTLMQPQSPYGVAKLYAYWIVNNYRSIYKGFFVNGILFNHESERRTENFVTRKITQYVAKYHKAGATEALEMGNMYSKRDWGYAPDYVEAMYLMLQQKDPEDFVISTGECHTVKEFIECAFFCIGVKIRWVGEGLAEKGYNKSNGDLLITVNPVYFRPTEVDFLLGDSTKAKEILGWVSKTPFLDLVKIMVNKDISKLSGN
jgi:GDPmannose 4,6-dehydratase